jgi:hypothetical protein
VTDALTDHVRDLLQRQSGVLSRAQALGHGMTRKQIEAYGVVVELDGRVAHPVELRWRDIHRDNATTVAGQRTLRYGVGRPVRAAMPGRRSGRGLLSRRGWDGRLRGCGRTGQIPAGQIPA